MIMEGMEKVEPEEENMQPVIENQSEEAQKVNTEEMRPPLITKVPKSKLWSRSHKPSLFACQVCDATFTMNQHLKHHIRRLHFNLYAKTPYYELKNVNQTWFEKVRNTDELIEIKKTGPNTLVMKRFSSNEDVEVDDTDKILDLSYMYPTSSKYKCIQCNICKISMPRKKYKKHYEKYHIRDEKNDAAF